jgi:hypothetical protein
MVEPAEHDGRSPAGVERGYGYARAQDLEAKLSIVLRDIRREA